MNNRSTGFVVVWLTISCAAPGWSYGQERPDLQSGQWLQYQQPVEAGFDTTKLEEARQLAESAGSTAVMVILHGRVLVAWGQIERPVEVHSVRKSLVGALYGVIAGEGKIDIQKSLADLGIDDLSTLSGEEDQAKIVDLLRSRSGVYHPAAKEPPDMKAERPPRGSHKPGEHFWYNNWDFNTLGVILEQLTGQKLFDTFDGRIAKPLGMQDFRPEHGFEQLEPRQSRHPAHAFRMSARDLARVGLLYQQKGKWDAGQVVPSSWVEESTKVHSPARNGGYGELWWAHPRGAFKDGSKVDEWDKFAARGTGGQFLLVIPEQELVYVHLADTEMGRQVRGPAVWKILETVLSGRTGEAAKDPALGPVQAVPFKNPLPEVVFPPVIRVEARDLDRYAGEYAAKGGLEVVVYRWQDRLFAELRGEGESELFAESRTKFFTKSGGARVEFLLGEDGKVTGANVQFRGQTSQFSKKE